MLILFNIMTASPVRLSSRKPKRERKSLLLPLLKPPLEFVYTLTEIWGYIVNSFSPPHLFSLFIGKNAFISSLCSIMQ